MCFKFFTSFVIGLLYGVLSFFDVNAQTSAVPFLLNAPDARAASMGDVGAALSPDVNSLSNNPSKIAFLEDRYGFSVSYSPWLKALVSDVNLGYVSGFYRLNARNTIGVSMRYFSLGEFQLSDSQRQDLGKYNPSEFAIDATFARKFGQRLSFATTFRYIHSNLSSGQVLDGKEVGSGTAIAADFSAFFKQEIVLLGRDAIVASGLYISNLGTKISYVDGAVPFLLPANLKVGAAITLLLGKDSELTIAADFNKLLVPEYQDVYGATEDTSVPASLFQAIFFSSGGIREKIKEVTVASGVEYQYRKQFSLRAGYGYGNPQKDNHSFLTAGIGFKYNIIGLDFAYAMASPQHHPLSNTIRLSLLINFNRSY